MSASVSGEPLRDMGLAGRTDAGRDLAEGYPVPASEARDAARMFARWGDRQSARFVAGSEYVRKGSPTRAFWLGFRRALRGAS